MTEQLRGLRMPRYTGVDADGVAETELDHLGNCPFCGALVDMRDLAQVLAHVHDQALECEEMERSSPPHRH